jgi:teichuronic acid exporter
MGFGVWALVAQQTLYHFSRMVLYYNFLQWRPKLIFSFEVIKGFWGFSVNLLGTAVLNVLFNNLYVLLLSKYYPIKQVGYYTQANKLNETFNFTFQSILVGSSYSILSKIHDDSERFRRVLREISKKTTLITIPIMVVLITISKPLVFVLLSEKWLPAVPLFQLLALATIFAPIYSLNITALNAKGHSRTTFSIEIIKKILIVLSVLLCFQMGILAMLWGYAAACTIAFMYSILAIKKHTNYYITHQIKDLIPSVSYSIILAFLAYALSFYFENLYLLLASQITLVGSIYILLLRITQPELYKKSIAFLRSKIQGLQP